MLSVKRRLAASVIARRIFIDTKEYNTLQLSPVWRHLAKYLIRFDDVNMEKARIPGLPDGLFSNLKF
jgi:hypothetical protein